MEPLSGESALVASCQAGRLDDFDPLYRHYVQPVYGYLRRRTLDTAIAEDLASLTFLKALERIGSYKASKGSFGAWLFTIARNALTDHFRSNRPHADIEDVWDLSDDTDIPSEVAGRMDIPKVRAALKTLDKSKREIVLLRIWDGLPYKDIAELTGKTETNCKVIFSRALSELRKSVPMGTLLLILLSPFRS